MEMLTRFSAESTDMDVMSGDSSFDFYPTYAYPQNSKDKDDNDDDSEDDTDDTDDENPHVDKDIKQSPVVIQPSPKPKDR